MRTIFKMVKSLRAIEGIFVDIWERIVTVMVFVFSVILSTGSFAWGYAGMGHESIARWVIAFGALWLTFQWRGVKWFSTFGLLLSILLAIIGLWSSFSIGWMFSGAIFALLAWDMTEMRQRLHLITSKEDVRGIERRHIARVSFLALGSLLFASFLILWWRQWTLEWGNFLLGVTLLGLLQIIAWLRK